MNAKSQRAWLFVNVQLATPLVSAVIHARLQTDEHSELRLIPLSASPSGRVNEIIPISRGERLLDLVFPGGGEVEPLSFEVRQLNWFERTWRMADRVLGALTRMPRSACKHFGVTTRRAVFNLPAAYAGATQLRFSVPYQMWVQEFDHYMRVMQRDDLNKIRNAVDAPWFDIVVAVDQIDLSDFEAMIGSLQRQSYQNFQVHLIESSINSSVIDTLFSNLALSNAHLNFVKAANVSDWLYVFNERLQDRAHARWVMLATAAFVLPEFSLLRYASAISLIREGRIFYSDDDALTDDGIPADPRFKPRWSLTHIREHNFFGDACFISSQTVSQAGGLTRACLATGNYDLLLRSVDSLERTESEIVHIPEMLFRRIGVSATNSVANIAAVQRHLERCDVRATVSPSSEHCQRIRYTIVNPPPSVSVIIPTRDAFDLVRLCVDSVLSRTEYKNFEVIIVDNNSQDPVLLKWLDEFNHVTKIRVLRYQRPFNYSAINNMAVAHASGDLVCLLNNDTEIITPDWLCEMVGQLQQPQVGAVGAKLLFHDGRVQHAGVVVGPGGCANHVHAFIPGDSTGYCCRAVVAQEFSAVTGACLLTPKFLYQSLGGLDAKRLKVAFNDVDYCLRLRRAGYRIVWTPHARLYHHESISRGRDVGLRRNVAAEMEVALMRRRWVREMKNDPFYNPNFNYARHDFSLTNFRGTVDGIRHG